MNNFSKIATGVALAVSLYAGNAMAATNGTLSTDSTGTSQVTLSITDQIKISDMHDIALGTWDGSNTVTGAANFCVYRNGGDGYQLTATTDNNAFALYSTTTSDSIPFAATVKDTGAGTPAQPLGYNTATTTPLIGSTSQTCGGSDNAQLQVTLSPSDLQKATTSNDYAATVTLYVQPI